MAGQEHETPHLGSRGRVLFDDLLQRGAGEGFGALALEAARIADRLDELDSIIAGNGVIELMRFRVPEAFDDDETVVEVKFDNVLAEARQQAGALRQILTTIGLSPASGSQPTSEAKGSPLDELEARRAGRGATAPR